MTLAKAFFVTAALMLCEPLEGIEAEHNSDASYSLSTVNSNDKLSEFKQPTNIEQVQAMIMRRCPCCHCMRYFPNEEFLNSRLALAINGEGEEVLVREITNYVGDIMPGRYCRFCGAKVTE
jgi:hypothetical protein